MRLAQNVRSVGPDRDIGHEGDTPESRATRLRLYRSQFLQHEIDCVDDLLGGPGRTRVRHHHDGRLLQRAELLKSGSRVLSTGNGRLHEASNELTR